MAVDLILPVPDVDAIIGTAVNKFDSIRLYRASSRGGTYALQTTITLVAADTVYTYTDATGTSTSWYKVTYYNSVTLNETLLTEAQPFPAQRGITTLKELRRMVLKNFGGEVHTVTGLAAQSVTAATLTDTARDADWFTGWHIFRPDASSSADYDRRVSAYTNTSGALTHGGVAYVDTTITDEELELSPLDIDFDQLNDKIGEGLERARFLYRHEFGAISSRRQYELPHFVEGPEYVAEMWIRFGDDAHDYAWHLFTGGGRWWKVRGSAFKCILDINPSLDDNRVMALDVWRPGEKLEGDTDFTYVHPLWAEAAAMVSVLEFLFNRDVARHGTSNYGGLLKSWAENLRSRARAYGPTGGMKIQVPQPPSGLAQV